MQAGKGTPGGLPCLVHAPRSIEVNDDGPARPVMAADYRQLRPGRLRSERRLHGDTGVGLHAHDKQVVG